MSNRFYTNVQMVGDEILVRYHENGKSQMDRQVFYPTLFVPAKGKKQTKYRTLDGDHVEPIKPGTIRECRDFLKKYQDVEGFKVYGLERFIFRILFRNILIDRKSVV